MAEVAPELPALVQALAELTRSGTDVQNFWSGYLRHFAVLCSGNEAMLAGKVEAGWKVAHAWVPPERSRTMTVPLATLAEKALKDRIATGRIGNDLFLGVRLDIGPQEDPPVILVRLRPEVCAIPDSSTLLLAASIPSFFQLSRQYGQARKDTVFMGELFQLVGAVAGDDKFKLAAMRVCNTCASLFNCGQVGIGWKSGKRIRTAAVGNLESFDENSAVVRDLEAAMEECAVREAEILWPGKTGSTTAAHAHETYAGVRRVGHLVSLPIRSNGEVTGVMTCEREEAPFSENEVWRLRLLLEQNAPWLARLEMQDAWFGVRWWRKLCRALKKGASPEGTGKKAAAAAGAILAGFLFFGVWPYSVDGTFILKAENSLHITAPVDGYIDSAPVEPGDLVHNGTLLVELDTRELLLDQSEALAQLSRHRHEAEKALASKSLADMRIAEAMQQEVVAEMERIAFCLKQARVLSPFDGVVAEGDLRTRIGAPVRQGEVLMTVASLDGLYAELRVNEKDICDIHPGSEAEISFVGEPDHTYRAVVEKIVPLAQVDKGENVFMVHALIQDQRLNWWRPGMSGVARFDMGFRSPWWVLTHDALDYLRLHFWI